MIPGISQVHEYRRQQTRQRLMASLSPGHQQVLARAAELEEPDLAIAQSKADDDSAVNLGLAGAAAAGLGAAIRNAADGEVDLAPKSGAERVESGRKVAIPLAAGAATLAAATSAAAARTPPAPEPGSGLKREYMDNVLEAASKFAFIDHAHMNWHSILQNEFADPGKSPFTANGQPAWPNRSGPRVAVIGGGISGLLTAWQLAKVGMRVTLYEGNCKPTNALGTSPGSGRIFPVLLDPATPDTRVELGCMRFPMTSYLFWHYVAKLGAHPGGNVPLVDFPNAGKVPTLFSRRDSRIYGTWVKGGRALPSDIQAMATRQILKFINYVPPRPADAVNTDASGKSAGDIAGLVEDQTRLNTPALVEMVRAWWNWAARDLHTKSYVQFLKAAPDPFSEADVELAGDLGFGFGGLWPLFPTSALDIMRLVLWSYAAEFELPELYKLPYQMLQRCQGAGVDVNYDSPVVGYYHVPGTGKYAVACQNSLGTSTARDYDFVVSAMSFKAARHLLDTSKSNKSAVQKNLGTEIIVPYVDPARPNYVSAFQLGDFNNQGVSSVKMFSTITGPAGLPDSGKYLRVRPVSNPDGYNTQVGTFFGASKVGVTYHIPKDGQVLREATTAIGLNYSWNAQADDFYACELQYHPLVGEALRSKGLFLGVDSGGSFASRIAQQVSELRSGAGDTTSIENWNGATGVFGGFSDVWKRGPKNPSRWAIVYWNNVPWSRMGFKLDFPNKGKWNVMSFQSSALSYIGYRRGGAEFNAWDAPYGVLSQAMDFPYMKKSRATAGVFFCGESFSHYGGWVEGAMQSALSNSMAVYYAAVEGTSLDNMNTGGDVVNTPAWKGLFGGVEAARKLWTADALVK